MRVFLGMVLGVLLTISGTYLADSIATGPQITSTPPAEQRVETPGERRTMVNWEVVGRRWESLKQRVENEWIRLSERKT
jgi:hypothetical protein